MPARHLVKQVRAPHHASRQGSIRSTYIMVWQMLAVLMVSISFALIVRCEPKIVVIGFTLRTYSCFIVIIMFASLDLMITSKIVKNHYGAHLRYSSYLLVYEHLYVLLFYVNFHTIVPS